MTYPAVAPSVLIQPLVSWPRVAEQGRTYMVTVDVRMASDEMRGAGDTEWPYEEEELPLRCMLAAGPACSIQLLGHPDIVLHRYGGTYAPARFLLTADEVTEDGRLRLRLVNRWGIPVLTLPLPMRVVPQTDRGPQPQSDRAEAAREAALHRLYELALSVLHTDSHDEAIALLDILRTVAPGYRDAAARRPPGPLSEDSPMPRTPILPPRERLQLVVFDLNDGLVGTESLMYEATREVILECSARHNTITLDSYAPYVGMDGLEFFSEMVDQYAIRGKTPAELVREREERYQTRLRDTDPGGLLKPGFQHTLELLRERRVRMAICSSAPSERVRTTLEQIGISKYFSLSATLDQGLEAKPSPKMYLFLLEKAGVQPQDCLVVESSLLGIQGSVAAGCPTILLVNDYTTPAAVQSRSAEIIPNSQLLAEWFERLLISTPALGTSPRSP